MSNESFNDHEFFLLEENQHIRKRLLVEGIDGVENTLCRPKTGDQVSIHYVMKLLDQTIVDQSDSQLPFTFRLYCQQVLPEIDVCVNSMKKDEKSEFLVDSTLLFGDRGLPGVINPNTFLVVWIHLLEIKEFCCVDKKCLNGTERIQAATQAKDKGNEFFKKNDKCKALEFYLQGVSLLESDNPEDTSLLEDSETIAISLYLNAANCYTSLKDWNNVLNYSNKVLIYDANNCKALYRSGMAHLELKELEEAKKKLTKALKKEPNNTEILKQLHLWKAASMVNSMRQKRLYGGIFHSKETNSFRDSLTKQYMASSSTKTNLVGFVFQTTAQSPLQAFYVEINSENISPSLLDHFLNFCEGNLQLKSVSCRGYYNSRFQSIQKHVLLQAGPFPTLMPVTFVDSDQFRDTHCYCEGDFCLSNDAVETENFNFFIPLNSFCCKSSNYVVIGNVCNGLSSLKELENTQLSQEDHLDQRAISYACNSHTFPKIILSQII